MFVNQVVECVCVFEDGKNICFESDSSPKAWDHYKNVYYNRKSKIMSQYNFEELFLYNRCEKRSGGNLYSDKPKKKNNRLFAMHNSAEYISIKGVKCCKPARRLGGECDFNFNDDKECSKFKMLYHIIERDSSATEKDKQFARIELESCKEMHHSLLNFSLIEAMGNLQGFKGTNKFDRLDTFIYELDRYFKGLSNKIILFASNINRKYLLSYLSCFNNIYDYCKEIYFIEDESFVDKIIEQGKLPIESCKDVLRYITLAKEFWTIKEFYFLKQEFLTVSSYFRDGGETHSFDALASMIASDFGYSAEESELLINKCEERGFITAAGDGVYTR